MRSLGVTSIFLGGRTFVNGLPIAGKGCVGLVVKARIDDRICALKIRRVDADRKNMDAEVRFHQIANDAGVGPQLGRHTKNFVSMEFAEGKSIIEWADVAIKDNMRRITRSVLEQCYRLDRAGLDHGELSRLDRHVIISHTPVIIDFESSSTARKTSNVTAATQSIFLYGPIAIRSKKILGMPDREKVINTLKIYKQHQSNANFDAILGSLSI